MMEASALTDEDIDDMLHALGRPSGSVWHGSYRNHYCIEVGSDTAKRFEALGCWDLSRTINEGRDAVYTVNADGKRAIEAWRAAKATPTPGPSK